MGSTIKTINQGLFGVHIAGIFDSQILSEDGPYSTEPWQWLSDLKPKSIRFPSGANGRFVHLRPYQDTNNDEVLDPIKGYGYDVYEIIRYFDVTDNKIDINTAEDQQEILDDLDVDDSDLDFDNNKDCDNCEDWMNAEDYEDEFEAFYGKWEDELEIPDGPNQSAIVQFIHLIQQIQTDNPGHVVDVLLCLNILSESAPKCKEIVTYLRDNDVNVVGVELGNEVYYKWGEAMMGFNTFANYWNFIRGGNSNSTWTSSFADYVFSYDMQTQHDYITAFKGDPLFTCKVGIPAENLDGEYALRETNDKPFITSWNISLANKYDYFLPGTSIYGFDAVIIHPYYDAESNYKNIAYQFDPPYDCPEWDYSELDSRLNSAFKGILGTSYPTQFGNFQDFIKTRFIDSYNAHKTVLKFNASNPNPKELWTTEWNIKDNLKDEETEEFELERAQIFNNSFPHGMVLLEWWLRNLKLNFQSGYKENFFTYSNLQNYAGTSYAATMLLDADCADLKQFGLDPDDIEGRYFLKRTSYYVMELLSEINKNNLQYVQANITKTAVNPNVQPTVFIDPDKNFLYVYFSNIKEVKQSYVINPDNLLSLYPEEVIGIGLGNATINTIDVAMPYSTSGKNTLFNENTCYLCNDEFASDNLHPFEISTETPGVIVGYSNIPECLTDINPGEACVTVNAYSLGYFKIPINVLYPPELRKESSTQSLILFPNPTNSNFKIQLSYSNIKLQDKLDLKIYNLSGKLIKSIPVLNNQTIDVHELQAGLYIVSITTPNNFNFLQQFIKL